MRRKHRSRPIGEGLEQLFRYIVLSLAAFIALGPIVWTFLTSIKTPLDAFARPPVWLFTPTLENYAYVIAESEFGKYFLNSVLVSASSTGLSLVIGSLAAYSLARFKFRGSKDLAFWILSTRMFPPIAAIIPLYLLLRFAGLLDTQMGLTLAYVVFNLPYVVWMMRGFFLDVPADLDESAMVDGCSRMGAFLRVILPLSAPGLVASALFCLVISWNEFLFALILTGTNAKTLPVEITGYLTVTGVKWGPVAAAGILIALPVLVFSIFTQRYLARGLTLGAVKG